MVKIHLQGDTNVRTIHPIVFCLFVPVFATFHSKCQMFFVFWEQNSFPTHPSIVKSFRNCTHATCHYNFIIEALWCYRDTLGQSPEVSEHACLVRIAAKNNHYHHFDRFFFFFLVNVKRKSDIMILYSNICYYLQISVWTREQTNIVILWVMLLKLHLHASVTAKCGLIVNNISYGRLI